MRPFLGSAVISLLTGLAVAVPRNVPPRMLGTPQALGHTYDPDFGPFFSDGGAGGYVNGYRLITLSDAKVADSRYKGLQVHTVYAYYGVANATDPRNITIIGNYKSDPHFYFSGPNGNGQGVISSTPNDPPTAQGRYFGPGPNAAMAQIPGNKTGGINAWVVHDLNTSKVLYNTLIEYNVVDPRTLINNNVNIPAARTIEQFYQADTQPMFGSAGMASDDKNLYMVAQDKSGFKLAMVPAAQRLNRAAYQYWNNSTQTYSNTIPTLNDSTTNFFVGKLFRGDATFGTDLYFSPYFQTWIFTYQGVDVYGAKYLQLAYSTTGQVTGPYSEVGSLYKPEEDAECQDHPDAPNLVYLTHSHPGWDPTGKTLLISWISCNTFTNMALITWK